MIWNSFLRRVFSFAKIYFSTTSSKYIKEQDQKRTISNYAFWLMLMGSKKSMVNYPMISFFMLIFQRLNFNSTLSCFLKTLFFFCYVHNFRLCAVKLWTHLTSMLVSQSLDLGTVWFKLVILHSFPFWDIHLQMLTSSLFS